MYVFFGDSPIQREMKSLQLQFWQKCHQTVLLAFFCVVPDLDLPRHSHHALVSSLELVLSSDVTDNDIRVYQEESQAVHFNYTLEVTGDSNHTLALAVCVTVDDASIARAVVSKSAIVPLRADLTGAFSVTVCGLFLGRAYLHVHFVVWHSDVRCGQPEARSLQELLRVSEGRRGKELALNVTRTSSSPLPSGETPTSSSSSSSSALLGVHSGRRYAVIVLRPERAVDMLFKVGVVILVVVINVGMGSKLDLQVVKDTLRRPFSPITGLCSQFLIMPLVSPCTVLRRLLFVCVVVIPCPGFCEAPCLVIMQPMLLQEKKS